MSATSEGEDAFPPSAERHGRRRLPPPVVFGFALLLALMFGGSYAVGHAVGPVAPGMHETGDDRGGDSGGMGGMDGMGMDRGSGH